jgi:hypothetical protein
MLLILIVTLFASLLNVNNNIPPRIILVNELKHNESTQLKHATPTNYQLQRNLTHVVTNASLTNNQVEISQNPWLLLLQFTVSDGVAGVALLRLQTCYETNTEDQSFSQIK